MKTTTLAKAIEKAGGMILASESGASGQTLKASLNGHRITASTNRGDDEVHTCYVIRDGAKDDLQSDYFAGSFPETIKGTLRLCGIN